MKSENYSEMNEVEKLDLEIDDLIKALRTMSPGTNGFDTAISNLDTLVKIRKESKTKIDPEILKCLVMIFGNIIIAAFVLNFEKVDVFSSKVLQFITKPRF